MHIIGFTIKQADLVVGNSPIREQAVTAPSRQEYPFQ